MRRILHQIIPTSVCCLAALLLDGCGESSVTSDQPVARIQGELINTPPATAPKITETPVATTPTAAAPTPVISVAAPVATTAPTTPAPPTATAVDGYSFVGFDKLASYNFEVPDDAPVTNKTAGPDKADEQIPSTVKAFNRQKVSIKGFMLPLKVEGNVVTEFLILKDQSMCCYGNVPKITEWVSVKTTGKGVKPIMDQPVNIEGTLHVGAMRENGYLVGIYQLDGDKLIETPGN
jgi:hypothetical protein